MNHRLLLSQKEIDAQVQRIAKWLDDRYATVTEPIVFVIVLNGSMRFAMDVIKNVTKFDGRMFIETIKAKSYVGKQSSVLKVDNNTIDTVGKHVVLIEDIVDTGRTLDALHAMFSHTAKTVTTITLLDKPSKRTVPLIADAVGFTIPDLFVIGFGLDYNGLYRELNGIYEMVEA